MQRDSLPEGAAQGGGRQMPTVLVVDDTPDNLAMMAELLGERYRVKVANSGERALKAMQAEALPDLVLLDIIRPISFTNIKFFIVSYIEFLSE